jgi:hypothetical protein
MKVCSIFSQVLKLFSRGVFEKAVKEHKAERHARSFTSWGQFVAMLFCQVGRAHSLREVCGGLACCEGHLKHLGVPVAPKKSTLAYANENRPWELYQTVFEQTLVKCQVESPEVELVLAGTQFQRIRGSASHRQQHPPTRPAVSPLCWTAVFFSRCPPSWCSR